MADQSSLETADHRLPSLALGSYELTAGQTVQGDDGKALTTIKERTLRFKVTAPRLMFGGDGDVHASFPPPQGAANYALILPHLVLARSSLPWERRVGGGGDKLSRPWLALIVLTEADTRAGLRLQSGPAAGLWPDGGLRPNLSVPLDDGDKAATISYVEMTAERLRGLCPTLEELPLLAHVRRVPLAAKADAGKGKGEFAVLTANRLPADGVNTALLVSLEGWGEVLAGTAKPSDGVVRLAVLHSWQFTSLGGGLGTFRERCRTLDLGALAIPAAPEWDEPLRWALEQGYAPIARQPEDGARTLAWYRGPLSPVAVPPSDPARPALVTPPEPTGFPEGGAAGDGPADLSQSSAWHLGRLLAISSAAFGTAMRGWLQARTVDRLRDGRRAGIPVLEDMEQVLMLARTEKNPTYADALTIGGWLARLRLLDQVPLRYLVPSGRHLPPESLRFFHLDTNWTTDALVMGALSLAVEYQPAPAAIPTRGDIRRTLENVLTLLRKKSPETPPAAEAGWGFLLRSRLLTEYPGVEVVLDGASPPLRHQRIGEDVLLVLAAGKPGAVTLREPREGLRFGCGAGLTVTSRTTPTAEPVAISRRGAGKDGVIDIAKLAGQLGVERGSGARLAEHLTRNPTDLTITWEQGR